MSTHFVKISLCYDKKWEIKLCILVNIYHRLLKLGMSTQISLCYNKKWEIKLCISVNIYHRLPELGMSTHFYQFLPLPITLQDMIVVVSIIGIVSVLEKLTYKLCSKYLCELSNI